MSGASSDKMAVSGQVGNEKDKIIFPNEERRNDDDRIVFPDEMNKESPQNPPDLASRNVVSVGLKEGYERDAKGKPVKEW